jgi:urease accessory protein
MMTRKIRYVIAYTLAVIAFVADSAVAHMQTGLAQGFTSGFLHPLLGPDHLIAMFAVGLWGAQLRHPAIWMLPITFPVVMAVGGVLGVMRMPLPFVEVGVATSAIILGGMIATHTRPPLWIAALMVGAFAVFHGFAHGVELPKAVNPLAYGAGFVVATGLLHLAGIIIGLLVYWPARAKAVRACGGVIALVGVFFLATHIGLIRG